MARIKTYSTDQILSEAVGQHKQIVPFLRKHGRQFRPYALPKEFRRGRVGVCFFNSYRMIVRHPQFTYVEGYGLSRVTGMVHLHAWCVDEAGYVLDRTWKVPALAYLGVPFKAEYLKSVMAERWKRGEDYFGLLDDWKLGCPVASGAIHPDVWRANRPKPVEEAYEQLLHYARSPGDDRRE